jgi:purine-binding chemotaxis protein CheW
MRYNGETTLSTVPKPKRPVKSEQKVAASEIDWDQVHKKFLDGMARLAWVNEVPEEVLETTWEQRAKQLAQTVQEEEVGDQIQIAVVRLGDELYGLETSYIYDIRQVEQLTRMPRVPDWVAGVTNLRGRIISVVDLRKFLKLKRDNDGVSGFSPRYIVVVQTQSMEMALLIDEVISVEAVQVNQIQDAGGTVRGIQPEYMRGILVRSGRPQESIPLLILDLPHILLDKKLIVQEDVI